MGRVADEARKRHPEANAPQYETYPGKYKTEKDFELVHRGYGHDPEFEKGKYDEPVYDKKAGRLVRKIHEPTWTDRGKELAQGLGKGVGNIVDTANMVVGAPLAFLGSKWLKGAGKTSEFIGGKEGEKYSKHFGKLGDDLQTLSNKYWNSNIGDEVKNSKYLKTRNADHTSLALKGAGEFLPDMIPANLIGNSAKVAASFTKAAPSVGKGLLGKLKNFTKNPMPAIANVLETNVTPKNAAMFAGAGAAHNIHNADSQGKENNNDTSFLGNVGAGYVGSLAGSRAAALGRGIKNAGVGTYNAGKSILFENPEDKLGISGKQLAKWINKKKGRQLDEEVIKLYKSNNLDLTPFDIYKEKQPILTPLDVYIENSRPYTLTKYLPEAEYGTILPKKRQDISNITKGILDKELMAHDTIDPRHDINYTISKLQDAINQTYEDNKYSGRKAYELAEEMLKPDDIFYAPNTLAMAEKIIKSTTAPATEGTAIGTINNIARKIKKGYEAYKHPNYGEHGNFIQDQYYGSKIPIDPKEVLAQRRALNQYIKKGEFQGSELERAQELKHAIDEDLRHSIEKGVIQNPEFLKHYQNANKNYAENIAPFKNNELFKKIKKSSFKYDDYKAKDALSKSLNDEGKFHDLKELLDLSSKKYLVDNKAAKEINEDLNWLRRIKLEEKLTGGAGINHFNTNQLEKQLLDLKQNREANDLIYNKEVNDKLIESVKPLVRKYKDLKAQDYKYHTNLDYDSTKSYSSGQLYKDKQWSYLPALLGGSLVGALTGGVGGTGLGAAAGTLAKSGLSKVVMKNMTNKQFVEELIRLGRIPPKAKKTAIQRFKDNPQLKFELIREIYNSNKSKKEDNR